HGRQPGRLQPREVGLSEPPGAGRAGAVDAGQVVAEDPGPDERLDVEVDDFARPVELPRRRRDGRRRAGQPASPWSGGTSSTQVLPGASFTSAPEASV